MDYVAQVLLFIMGEGFDGKEGQDRSREFPYVNRYLFF